MALSFTVAALALSAASMVQAQDSQSPVSEQDRRILQLEQLVEKMGERFSNSSWSSRQWVANLYRATRL